ncbi:MAG: hypothetical protein OSA98_23635 [Rubripirellula sp.]|nr:hypothetical protein [Rubripirellula sp.]
MIKSANRKVPFLVFHQAGARKAEPALIQGDCKIVKLWALGQVELFNFASDLSGQRDLPKQRPGKLTELEQKLNRVLDDVGAVTEQNTTKNQQTAMFAEAAQQSE